MKRAIVVVGITLAGVIAVMALRPTAARAAVEITPAMQKKIDESVQQIRGWAADAVVVKAVEAQNAKGPIAGMDNAKWKAVRRSDDMVKGFQSSDAGQFLKQKLAESHELYSEAFLNGAQGEKVAFVEKTSSYVHKGAPKFDVPFTSGKPWQGQPEFDESAQAHLMQVSVPVVAGGKPAGVLVVGINVTQLQKTSGQ